MPTESQKKAFHAWVCLWEQARFGSRGASPHLKLSSRPSVEPLPQAYVLLKKLHAQQTHALGNPLAGLSLATELLVSHRDRAEDGHIVSRIQRCADRIHHLCQLWSALAGAAPPLEQKSLADVIDSAGFEKSQVYLDCDDAVMVSRAFLCRHVLKLLRNNLPPSQAFGLSVRHQAGLWTLSLLNRGPKVPVEYLGDLWRQPLTTPDSQGGVGLLQVAWIVETLLEGWVAYTPVEGGGSAFHLDIPLSLSDAGPRGYF